MKKSFFPSCGDSRYIFLVAILLILNGPSFGQAALICDNEGHLIEYSGTFQDFLIPVDSTIIQVEILAKGGDGGFAELGDNCRSNGGEGASLSAVVELGPGANQVPHGSTLRFIVGQAGEKGTAASVLGTGFTYGGGGGGTGILYKTPDSDEWVILAVAGGGGGAYQGEIIGFCVDNENGQGGRAETTGGNGNGDIDPSDGGINGNGGQGSFEISAGGGGAFSAGQGIACIEIFGTVEVGEGQAGFPEGGAGGASEGCVSFTFRDGGFGFGGGGAGIGAAGGGGGYSGGGGGGSTGRGGGGGSFLQEQLTDGTIQAGAVADETLDGFVEYKCIRVDPPVAPVAACIGNTEITLNENGLASITTEQIDNGSFHPEAEAFTLSIDPTGFDCADIGSNSVVLTITSENGLTDQCETTIKISDPVAPELECPENTMVACDTSALALTGEAIALDNCTASPTLTYSDLISGDCEANCTIERIWIATDASGNSNSCSQIIERSPVLQIGSAFEMNPTSGTDASLTLGFTHHTLTIAPEAANCVVDWLSTTSFDGTPSPLANGNYTIDGTNCQPAFIAFDADGNLENPLLAQALLLNIHIRLNPDLAQTQISSLDCAVHPVLLQALPSNATFEDLQTITNYALANLIFAPFLDLLTNSLECFNNHLSFCRTSEGLQISPLPQQNLSFNSINEEEIISTLYLFPNPAENYVYINPNYGYGQEAVINIHDVQGKLVLAMNISELTTNAIRLNLYNFSSGIYEVLLFTKGQPVQSGKLVIQ